MSSRDDAKDFYRCSVFLCLFDAVRDHQQEEILDRTKCPPSLFPILRALPDSDVQRILKYFAGGLKTDPMLALVGVILGFIPLQPGWWSQINCNYKVVITKLFRFSTKIPGQVTKQSPQGLMALSIRRFTLRIALLCSRIAA
jgi:hypothetical protein